MDFNHKTLMYTTEWQWPCSLQWQRSSGSVSVEIPDNDDDDNSNTIVNITDRFNGKAFVKFFSKRHYDQRSGYNILFNCMAYYQIPDNKTSIECTKVANNVTKTIHTATIANWPETSGQLFVWSNTYMSSASIFQKYQSEHICIDFKTTFDDNMFTVYKSTTDCVPKFYEKLQSFSHMVDKLQALTYYDYDHLDYAVLWFNIDGRPMYCTTPVGSHLSSQCTSESKLQSFMSQCFKDLPTLVTTITTPTTTTVEPVSHTESSRSTDTTNTTTDANTTTTTTAVSVSPTEPVESSTGIILMIVIIVIIIIIVIVVVFISLILYLKTKSDVRKHENQLSGHQLSPQKQQHQQQADNISESILNDSSIVSMRSYRS
ncbi:uncharacterized protein LOC128957319 [Oppia nitens]|uniref:uncharacterized protein LOC128957319 n=1 Tax=Oppia nitens TaxID=1686743 RepID=UPI0023DB163B|nr:uncharacterized protein LOC128957319 [Oppia nitens]